MADSVRNKAKNILLLAAEEQSLLKRRVKAKLIKAFGCIPTLESFRTDCKVRWMPISVLMKFPGCALIDTSKRFCRINNSKGYPTMYFHGKRWLLYHLVKWYYDKQTTYDSHYDQTTHQTVYNHFPGISRRSVDLSHVCHRKNCLNPLHLQFELQSQNLGRNGCVDQESCSNHHSGGTSCILNCSLDFTPARKHADHMKKTGPTTRSVILKYKGQVRKLM